MTNLPEHLPTVIQAASPFVSKYGYFGVSLLLLIENFGIPLPGETTLIVAALFAGIGKLNIFLVILVAFITAVLGDSLAFLVGTLFGAKIIKKFGKYILLPPKRYEKFERYFNNKGYRIVLVARFIDVLRQLNGLIAGTSEMSFQVFLIFNSIGALLWVVFWSCIGYFAANHIGTFLKYELYVSILFGIFAILYIIFKVKSNRDRRKSETEN